MESFFRIIQDHYTYRKQVLKLAKSDLIKTYRGAALGWIWALIKPVSTIAVFWFAFTVGLRKGGDVSGYPFFLWLISGMVPWFYITEMLTQGTECIRSNRHLVTKMRFPVSTIPTFVSISKAIINFGLLIITIVIFHFFGYRMDIYYIQLPLYFVFMVVFFTFLTLLNASFAAVSKDYANLLKAITTPLFWLSGILWNPADIKIGWLRSLLLVNPITYIATGYRNVFIYKKWFFYDDYSSIAFVVLLFITTALSVVMYNKIRKDLPDVL